MRKTVFSVFNAQPFADLYCVTLEQPEGYRIFKQDYGDEALFVVAFKSINHHLLFFSFVNYSMFFIDSSRPKTG